MSVNLRLGFLGLLLCWVPLTHADCTTDMRGEVYCGAGRCAIDGDGTVWCSRHYDGDVQVTLDGRAFCGKGMCAKDSYGQIFCSSEIGGAVATDTRGRVRCYGKCEQADAGNCENTRADSAGN